MQQLLETLKKLAEMGADLSTYTLQERNGLFDLKEGRKPILKERTIEEVKSFLEGFKMASEGLHPDLYKNTIDYPDYKSLSVDLQRLIGESDLSVKEIAKIAGYTSPNSVYYFWSGTHVPTPIKMKKILNALGWDITFKISKKD